MSRTRMNPWLVLACLLATFGSAVAADSNDTRTGVHGFGADSAARQLALERKFDAQLDPAQLRTWLQQLASRPNHVGSPHNKANAEFMRDSFRQWGWDAHIETFHVLYPTPQTQSLQLVSPGNYTAKLHEPPVVGDASSALEGALPPYNIYGADGDVTAELVYVDYGMPDDYAALARRGIDVRGKVVIVRYGGGWRGLKPKLAQQHGAVGCLIYSDPHGAGYFRGDPYPKGGWQPADGVQRGSVEDMQVFPGDPLTPGTGSTADARRLSLEDAKSIMRIPVMPISYADATPLLQALGGPVAPENWRGALPLTYHIGPGPAKVHMVVKSRWEQKPVYDVIATLKGSTWPDQWIIRGNHRDAWVFGAWDPLSGTAAMLAEAKAMGTLYKDGWRPRRTIVYTSWDGEEAGLLGSTEWGETHADELRDKAVMYVNSDNNSRGFLSAGGSHSLQHLVNQVADGVKDPETGVSVGQRLRARMLVAGYASDAEPRARAIAERIGKGGDLPIQALGSGSDFSVFLEHLGIASLSLGFGGEGDNSGVYHSRYDSFEHYVRFGDPDFQYGVALAKMAGHVVLRSADADVLPMRFGDFGATLQRYVTQLHQLVDDTRKATRKQHQLLDMHAYQLVADPTRPVGPPARRADVPKIDLAPLDQAADRLHDSLNAYREAYAARATAGFDLPAARLRKINMLIGHMEQHLTDADGLPGRPWFKHMIYAPGMLTGYGVKTLPGVREAIEGQRWEEAGYYAKVTAGVLDRYREQLDRLTALLREPS